MNHSTNVVEAVGDSLRCSTLQYRYKHQELDAVKLTEISSILKIKIVNINDYFFKLAKAKMYCFSKMQ